MGRRGGRHWAIWMIVVVLIAVALACNAAGAQETDTQATVVAVYATITAQAAAAGSEGDAVTATAGPGDDDIAEGVTPSLSPTAPAERSGNGETVELPRCAAPITVDGAEDDWTNGVSLLLDSVTYGATQWAGADDLSGSAQACWTDTALYVVVSVMDNVHVQTQTGANIWRGDEVEIVFDGDLQGDFYSENASSDDVQLGLSAGDFDALPTSAELYFPTTRDAAEIDVAARRPAEAVGGYRLEASVPWSLLGVTPAAGRSYGFCLALSDNDQVDQASQDSMVSHCLGLAVRTPTTWATMRLTE